MTSPELLRRFPFFAGLSDRQMRAIAMIGEEVSCPPGTILFHENQPVEALYLLTEGHVELYYTASRDAFDQLLVGEIGPGEPFGISALVEPYTLTATARVGSPSHLIRFQASALRALCDVDPTLGYYFMRQIAHVMLERLHFTRVQLAAARQLELAM